jgi:hypothetical protein
MEDLTNTLTIVPAGTMIPQPDKDIGSTDGLVPPLLKPEE